ncbi:MAG TPA: DUF6351 family protein [Verrucomicrobiae bacterium]|nr:DUF6351 family protein [Verrucomicrobiae bacterium]
MPILRRALGLAPVLLLSLAGCSRSDPATDLKTEPLEIRVLSNRADLVSGDDALVELVGIGDDWTVDVDGRDVTGAFARRDNGRVLGRIEGLAAGANVVTLKQGSQGARLTITNHPSSGPIIAGAQLQPWDCTTTDAGLEAAADATTCTAPVLYEFFYKSTAGGSFRAYDPENPPTDVATTTTDQGKSVPYIIRQETGTQNRGIYTLAVLFDPAQGWEPWAPQSAWNGKLHYPFGASCGTNHTQGSAQNVQDDLALSRGFMVASSSLNELGHACNTWLSAESVMMLKEHIVDRYGEIRYTMAEGCSGGSIGQHMVGNNYPGLLQGIQPNCSYMDNWSTGLEVIDCHLLLNYTQNGGLVTPALFGKVSGHQGMSSCVAWEGLFAPVVDPEGGCGASSGNGEYNAATNPAGCRGSVQDYNVGVLGKRSAELWDDSPSADTRAAEALVGGFARFAYDNTGVQYGLEALLDGAITAVQFVDLNQKIGSVDVDFNFTPGRRTADPGTELLYRAGGINDAAQLDGVAIIDLRGTSNAEIHTDYHSWGMRARLDKANGHHDNQLIWTFASSLVVPPSIGELSFVTLDAWLAAVEADTGPGTREQKIARNKPAAAVDQCFTSDASAPPERDMARCATLYPYYGSPRLVAGMPITHDNGACQKKPLVREDYGSVIFTDAQWATLASVFPDGVCDWSKPPQLWSPSVPWLTHDGAGGVALGEPPRSTALSGP